MLSFLFLILLLSIIIILSTIVLLLPDLKCVILHLPDSPVVHYHYYQWYFLLLSFIFLIRIELSFIFLIRIVSFFIVLILLLSIIIIINNIIYYYPSSSWLSFCPSSLLLMIVPTIILHLPYSTCFANHTSHHLYNREMHTDKATKISKMIDNTCPNYDYLLLTMFHLKWKLKNTLNIIKVYSNINKFGIDRSETNVVSSFICAILLSVIVVELV